jgi:hypothetical protein
MFYLSNDGDIGYGECIGAGDTFDSQAGLLALFEARKMSKETVTELYNSFAGVAGPFADLRPWGGCVKNHKYGAERIWKVLQLLTPGYGEPPTGFGQDDVGVETRKPGDKSALETSAAAELELATEEDIQKVMNGETMKKSTKRKGLAAKVQDELAKPATKGAKGAKSPRSAPKEPKAGKTTRKAAGASTGERKPRVKGEGKKDQAARLMLRKSGATLEDFKELGWNEGSVTMFSQWVALVVRNGIKSFAIEKNKDGEKVYKAAA